MEEIQEMKQVSVSEILKENSLVVPEIQREYVWGRNDYDILDSFLEDIKKGFNKVPEDFNAETETLKSLIESANEDQKKVLLELLSSKLSSSNIMNIGFLYSYKPNYYVSDEGKDAYLIDGQQRFTTIFLILFYLAIKEGRTSDFHKLYRVNKEGSKIAFDYRVRVLTHNFIFDLISNSETINDLKEITKKRWFLLNYRKDTTIKSIVGEKGRIGTFEIIDKHLNSEPVGYFDFVRQNIKFWHFKTEETSQGEELYITMNFRGQQLADNETIRAILFQTEIAKKDPLKWSTSWEEWQDYFWKHRSESVTTADKGFNEFLSCIAGLENYLEERGTVYSKSKFDQYSQISTKHILLNINLITIQSYFEAFKFINDKNQEFKVNYLYSDWVEKALKEIWRIINSEYTNWFAGYDDQNRATERNRMVFIWPVLAFFNKRNKLGQVSVKELYRVLRIFYLRYMNFDRSVTTIKRDVENFSDSGPFKAFVNPEEFQKHNLYNWAKYDDVERYEELIWEIEDHKFNINGRDVGSVNIGYMVDLEKIDSIDSLKKIKDKLYEIFPEKDSEYLTVQNILLSYGEYWHRVSPWYYRNYQFDNWKRIIRDRDQENKHTRNVFKSFIDDFVNFEGTLQSFELKLTENRMEKSKCDTLNNRLIWYNQSLLNKMWSQGNFIAISIDGYENALPDSYSNDGIFDEEMIIYNTKGDLRGGSPKSLYDLLSNKQKIED